MLKSSVCDYSDAYTLVKGSILKEAAAGANPNNNDKEVVFKSCAPLIDFISEMENTK